MILFFSLVAYVVVLHVKLHSVTTAEKIRAKFVMADVARVEMFDWKNKRVAVLKFLEKVPNTDHNSKMPGM